MPALICVILPTGMLLSLRDRLQPGSHNKQRPQPATPTLTPPSHPLALSGFEGWTVIRGTGQASKTAGDMPGVGGPSRAPDGHTAAAEVPSGLNCGFSSLADARLALHVVLLSKFQMDDAALEAAGGCPAVKAVRPSLCSLPRFSQ
jgi:hypothetical protein